MPEFEITIVTVDPESTWDCERCAAFPVIAYVAVEDDDVTVGYCRNCLPLAVVSVVEEKR